MDIKKPSAREIAAANQNQKEKKYWINKLSGQLTKSSFSFDHRRNASASEGGGDSLGNWESLTVKWTGELFSNLVKISTNIDQKLHILLVSGLVALLDKFNENRDIIVGTPIYKQEIEGEFINTLLALRNQLQGDITFKELVLQVRQAVVEAMEHQDYPIRILLEQLNLSGDEKDDGFPLFEIVILLENIQDRKYIRSIERYMNIIFSFLRTDSAIEMVVRYQPARYNSSTIERIAGYFTCFMSAALSDPDVRISSIEIISEEEKDRLLFEFNETDADYPGGKGIHLWVEEQAARTPANTAVIEIRGESVTYRELNEKANRLARFLQKRGVTTESVVGIMMKRSIGSVTAVLAILKAGGTYLPIDTGLPRERVRYMLENSNAEILLATSRAVDEISFTSLQNFESTPGIQMVMTPLRGHIKEFDRLPMPDRSLVNLGNYKNKIGMASVTDCISLQTTRGCPYECLFCHKVWSKHHVFRSAENIYNEVEYYYERGVRNFAVIDDCFNLNRENSSRFFKRLVKNKLDIQLFFPNGLRGDILTSDYIDLMMEAGTRGINLSLETASPRLQKLIKKDLDIDKFKKNIDYIAAQYPGIILEIAVMHGFPSETEEEAMMTLDFIKGIRWLHFPYIHILKIYPNTEMEQLALKHGISREDIMASKDLAYHELPETLPFPKSFTRKYQSDFLNNYFLRKDRLQQVLPVQMKILSEEAMLRKYNTYLPAEIDSLEDILELAGMDKADVGYGYHADSQGIGPGINIFDREPELREEDEDDNGKKRILLLDLSQHFSTHGKEKLYRVDELPLGLVYLLTNIKQQLGDKINGRVYKSGNDFDSFEELKVLVDAYKPHLLGIRTLTYYREFFHETVSLLRQWGVDVPIIAGGPYATSDYDTILKDKNIDLVVQGEGEYTLLELLEKMLENDFKIPGREVLRTIRGIVFTFTRDLDKRNKAVEVILADKIQVMPDREEAAANPEPVSTDKNLAYVMYTSGSTGKPKGVMVEHRQVNNCICWMQEKFNLSESAVVAQRTNLTFDPSVWEIFWPLYIGGAVKIIDDEARIDVEYLTRLMTEDPELTIMYCPSTLLNAITLYLDMKPVKPRLKLPWLIIGAEPIAMEVIKRFYSCYEGRIVNTYGPTEGVINNTYYDLYPADERSFVPIGKPVANNRIYILSGDLKLLPIGIAGEICIAGDSVARGYINDREKTLYSFISNPFGTGKLYKTGDVGRWLEDGNIEIMGRLDDQVKIRGHRIELGEIETALSGHPSILNAVVAAKTTAELKEQTRECKTCGIWSNYPGVKINDESICNICENLSLYKTLINRYFSTPEEMELKIREGNRNRSGEYDCILVYACERVATYALYRLLDMGFNILTVTYDSGHYEQESLDRIKRITEQIGVDHIFLRHKDSDRILKESLRTAKTMCKGCIHTSTSLAGEYAYENNIKYVIGETLSRGQIVENKLFKFLEMGIHDIDEIEREVDKLMRNVAALDKNIFDIINIDIVKDGSMYDKVEFIDFYRYFNVTNEEMAAYLDEKDAYWKNLENRAIYSTDCKICKIGDYNHFKELGYHYTGSAKSWEKRLGHATMKDVKEDLTLTCTPEEHALFLKGLGYREEIKVDKEEKHLCAYYVPEGEIDVLQLREYLAGELPGYMIPSYFIALEKIPLTPNGKIDRKALPAPQLGIKAGEDYAAPETDVEEKLKAAWEEVLGVGGISVNDDLFKLGGDSIKAIRIVSKLQRYNLKLEIRDLFLNPTVKKAARCVEPMSRKSDQGPVEGDVPLTPVQEWFFERNFTPRHHFNQSLMLYREQGFNQENVEEVFTKIIQHHDALRMVFKRDENTGDVTQFNRPIRQPLFDMEVIDLTEATASDSEIADNVLEHAQRLQQRIDLVSGPLVKLGLFKTAPGKGDHLLIIIHHLVVDGISWQVLLEDFETGYEQAREGIDINFQDKTDSFKYWSEKLSTYAQSEDALKEADYWAGVEEAAEEIPELPKDFTISPEKRKLADTGAVVMTLDKTGTEKLLKDMHKVFNTEINDILLTALGLALKEWAGLEKAVIKLEGHGRETIMDDVNISRTVGWFTTQFPVLLDLSKENELSGHIKTVKETLRQIPHRGIGYGILRHLGPGTGFGLEPEIVFNYLGQLGTGQRQEGHHTDAIFVMSSLPRGDERSPDMMVECAIHINGGVTNGELGLSFAYNTKEFKQERIEALAACYKSGLTRIIEYCSSTEDTEMTVSDFDAVDLDAEEMEDIYDELELE